MLERQNQLFAISPEPVAIQTEALKSKTSHYSKVRERKTEIEYYAHIGTQESMIGWAARNTNNNERRSNV